MMPLTPLDRAEYETVDVIDIAAQFVGGIVRDWTLIPADGDTEECVADVIHLTFALTHQVHTIYLTHLCWIARTTRTLRRRKSLPS